MNKRVERMAERDKPWLRPDPYLEWLKEKERIQIRLSVLRLLGFMVIVTLVLYIMLIWGMR